VSPHSENARQWVHIGSGAFAILLRWLTWWQAAILALVALVFNVLLLPRIGGRRLYRPSDVARGFPPGILFYPLSVLLLILTFPSRLDIIAAAWAILAVGDGMATLVGHAATTINPATAEHAEHIDSASSALIRRPIPWNRDKSIAGTTAFIVFGGLAGVALAWWVRPAVTPPPPLAFALVAPLAGAVAAALVESIPSRLDDNLSVPAAAAAVLWAASLIDAESFAASRAAAIAALPMAIAINAGTAILGYLAKSVSVSGALAGAIVGTIIYIGGGAGAWALLFAAFLAATVTSRMGLKRKVVLGIAEERGGRRGAGNAIANCGVAAIAAIVALTTPYRSQALLALVAALTAGGSDTVASEIGKAWGKSTFLVTNLARVKPGTPGAMSLEGTTAGVVAASALALVGVGLGQITASMVLAVVIGATAGALVESALGATLEGPGILNNDMLNFVNTAVASAVALVIA
jgi:uncharacterized protein (TIGR00297 family)